MNLKGLEAVIANLNKEIKAIEGRSLAGMIRAAVVVRRSTEETPPLTPVDLGNLRASWFTHPGYAPGGNPFLTMGYSANYAVYVHEMVGAKFQRPGAGAKWFQAAFRRNKDRILEVIREEAQIK
jgi:hypothetical protein